MSGTDRDDHGEVLVALTLHRATHVGRIWARTPENIPGTNPGFKVTGVSLDGMARLHFPRKCDQCGISMPENTTVLGKIVTQTDYTMSGSFFSPTCLECFYEDRGGYYSTAVAALVMET